MDIQIDSREKAKAIQKIKKSFDQGGVNYFFSKLMVGDYMNLDNPRLIIDRKQNLQELYGNVCHQHERFKKELIKAMQAHIQLVILVEHGSDVKCLEDVYFFYQPEMERFRYVTRTIDGKQIKTREKYIQKEIKGTSLFRSLCTIRDRYNVQFEFCNKKDTGKRIMGILSDGQRNN